MLLMVNVEMTPSSVLTVSTVYRPEVPDSRTFSFQDQAWEFKQVGISLVCFFLPRNSLLGFHLVLINSIRQIV